MQRQPLEAKDYSSGRNTPQNKEHFPALRGLLFSPSNLLDREPCEANEGVIGYQLPCRFLDRRQGQFRQVLVTMIACPAPNVWVRAGTAGKRAHPQLTDQPCLMLC